MEHAELFLGALDRKAKPFAASARATFEANKQLCSWLLNPLARWAEAAYGEKVFDDAACGMRGIASALRRPRRFTSAQAGTLLKACRKSCLGSTRMRAMPCLTCGLPFSSMRFGHP